MHRYPLLSTFLGLLYVNLLAGQSDTVILSSAADRVDPNAHCRLFIVKENGASDTNEMIGHLPFNGGYRSDVLRISMILLDTSDENRQWVLMFKHPLLDNIDIRCRSGDSSLAFIHGGTARNQIWPALMDITPVFALPSFKGRAYSLEADVSTTDVCALSLSIMDIAAYTTHLYERGLFLGLYFSAIFILAFFNLSLGLYARFQSCGWYALYILFFALFQASGLGFLNLVHPLGGLGPKLTPALAGICIAFATQFAMAFLPLKKISTSLVPLCRMIQAWCVCIIVLAFLGRQSIASMLLSLVVPFYILTCIIVGVLSTRYIGRPAWFYSAGAVALFCGALLNVLRNFGLIPPSEIAAHGNIIGSGVEAVILAIALVNRITDISDQKQKVELKAKMAEHLAVTSKLRLLQSQVNPHFLFNSLNTIIEFIPKVPERAESQILQLAAFFRHTLSASHAQFVLLETELEIVRTFLSLEKERFESRLEYTITINGDSGNAGIPGIIVQPIVENCIKHVVARVSAVTALRVYCEIAEHAITIRVSDNGPGFNDPECWLIEGHGLDNIYERIRLIYNGKATMRCFNQMGAVIELTLPRYSLDELQSFSR